MNSFKAILAVVITLATGTSLATGADPGDEKLGQLFIFAVSRDQEFLRGTFVVDAETGTWRKIVDSPAALDRVSPDGRILAHCTVKKGGSRPDAVWLYDVVGATEPRRLAPFGGDLCWSPDGREVIISSATEDDPSAFETWRVPVDGQEHKRLEIPKAERVTDWSADGRWLLTSAPREQLNEGQSEPGTSLFVRRADGSDPHPLTEGDAYSRHFAPDSQRVAFARREPGEAEFYSLWVINRDGSGLRKVVAGKPGLYPYLSCWSPDGKWLAVDMREELRDQNGNAAGTRIRIELVPLDGTPARRLEIPHQIAVPLDWR